MAWPSPVAESALQAALIARQRRYQEVIIRDAHLKAGGWPASYGWTTDDDAPFKDLTGGLSATTCDKLRYRQPRMPTAEELAARPIAPPASDDSVLRGIARLDLAGRDPGRQQELFGWSTPVPGDVAGAAAFEAAKATYWAKTCDESLFHLRVLKETADFGANYLVRLLYLAGELPWQLRDRVPWRDAAERDVNFAAAVEADIIAVLSSFKFWVDEPFYSDGGYAGGDRERITAVQNSYVPKDNPVPGQPQLLKEPEWPGRHIDADQVGIEMTTWSENHQVLFATVEYLAGQWLPDTVFRAGRFFRPEGPDAVRPGDLTGAQHMRKARVRLLRWLEDRLRFGFSEWNAPGYYEEDLPPLFNLADFCLDDDIRTRALMVLDLVFFDLARFSHRGSFGVTAGRAYYEHKACGYDQSPGDLVEVAFGTRGGVIVDGAAASAGSFASSRGYRLPDALMRVGQHRPDGLVDRTRVSLTFGEGPIYGVGTKTLEDAMFWWSRAAFFNRETLACTRDMAAKYHLGGTPPFSKILPTLKTVDAAAGWGVGVLYALTPAPLWPVAAPLLGSPWDDRESGIADALSVMIEGSTLTRANLYTWRTREVMLSSVQGWRKGQLNFQTQACQATLSPGATVWTTYPSAGSAINLKPEVEAAGAVGGAVVGASAGAAVLGPVGAVAGGIAGAILGAEEGGDIAPDPISIFPATHDGPNWWTGTVVLPRIVQHRGAAIQAYSPPQLQRLMFGERTHAWFPQAAFDRVVQRAPEHCNVDDGMWTFGQAGDGYVGLFSAQPPVWTTEGTWKDRELIAEGERNVFIYQVGSRSEFGDFDQFVSRVAAARIHINGLHWRPADYECSYDVPGGKRLELHYDDGPRYDGRPLADDGFPRFETPYVSCGRARWEAYHYSIELGDTSVTHDFRELRTASEVARVHRVVDQRASGPTCAPPWTVAYQGAASVQAENTVDACRVAVVDQGADGLAVDVCLTADAEVVLWHDWDPDGAGAVWRQLFGGGAFRIATPSDPAWRRPVGSLTLAELRAHYGYRKPDADGSQVQVPLSTLSELVAATAEWPGFRHLLLEVRPTGEVAIDAGAVVRALDGALPAALPFDVTLLVSDEATLGALRAAGVPGRFELCLHRTVPRDLSAPAASSGVDAAITAGLTTAASGRPAEPALFFAPAGPTSAGGADTNPDFTSANAASVLAYDAARLESFNLNPRENRGRQVKRLLWWDVGPIPLAGAAVQYGVTGVITNDIPSLRAAIRADQPSSQ